VHAVILAGGPSDNALARYRAMPAVELGEFPSHQREAQIGETEAYGVRGDTRGG